MDEKSDTDNSEFKKPAVISEGKAEILLLEKNVFYNPVQEFNRDLSIVVLSAFSKDRQLNKEENATAPCDKLSQSQQSVTAKKKKELENEDGITILEALSATGLRSIRYAKEVPFIKQIVANDISAKAVESIKKNIAHNKVEDVVVASHEDATMLMYQRRKDRFHAIDLDPYGCPSIFLDGAVQCVVNGGLLMVTATDMAVLAGNSPETCYVKYGAVSLKSKSCHEFALRILLQHISTHAGRYGRYIVPLLSISVDFYIRVFVRVHVGQLQCKNNTSQLGMVYQCNGCESIAIHRLGLRKQDGAYKLPNGPPVDRLCKFCQHSHHMGGPIWLGILHDKRFVSKLLNNMSNSELGTSKRLIGVLSVVLEELDIPLYYTLDRLMSIVRCQTPPMVVFRSALLNAGFKVTYSHANKVSIKTDAPNEVIWDIVRAWEKTHQSKRDRMEKGCPALAILEAPITTDVKFDLRPDANPRSRQAHMSRFQVNPTANWGPGARSTTIVDPSEKTSKRQRNQNKNTKHKKQWNVDKKDEKQIEGGQEQGAIQSIEETFSEEVEKSVKKKNDVENVVGKIFLATESENLSLKRTNDEPVNSVTGDSERSAKNLKTCP
ncbi:probable tRNA (guanine(26)-N(2))-dimethyltransferase [Venturia canescens]|uniref:probable tRNA (guanine(26)-N(2))-dimethyltransferase n=1 Tax=Venturia canescens TaxID=32260 RepID=UPI001C9D39CE|nr:probable tRNA (guanine(26)-N(2))-dimethyltransferase [Venturia canescens]